MKKNNKSLKPFSQHLDERYGKKGTTKRTEFETRAKAAINAKPEEEEYNDISPLVRSLSGVLKSNTTLDCKDDYVDFLSDKYKY